MKWIARAPRGRPAGPPLANQKIHRQGDGVRLRPCAHVRERAWELEAERVAHRQEVKQAYEEHQALQGALANYQTLLGKTDNLRV